MLPGFFQSSRLQVRKPLALVPKCGRCRLDRTCHSPKMPVAGRGRRKILVVGESPGEEEDKVNKPFVGPSGAKLNDALSRLGVGLFEDCWVTNSFVCKPVKGKEAPAQAVEWCRPNVINAVRELRPELILLLGAKATESVIGHLWRGSVGGVGRWVGRHVPCRQWDCWVCPCWHPSFLLHAKGDERELAERLWAEQLSQALAQRGRPYCGEPPPNYEARVRVLFDGDEAAEAVAALTKAAHGDGRPLAIDLETTTLKPDGPRARIYSCAVSDGRTAVSYPWVGRAIWATQGLILDGVVKKIAAGCKFEERWFMKEFGHGVKGWAWDTMVLAHCLDNRPGVTSVKFNAFARFGVEDYAHVVGPYLEGDTANGANRITEVDLGQLLLYGGLDALLEYLIAAQQRRELYADQSR